LEFIIHLLNLLNYFDQREQDPKTTAALKEEFERERKQLKQLLESCNAKLSEYRGQIEGLAYKSDQRKIQAANAEARMQEMRLALAPRYETPCQLMSCESRHLFFLHINFLFVCVRLQEDRGNSAGRIEETSIRARVDGCEGAIFDQFQAKCC
jgi:hypothetical protein